MILFTVANGAERVTAFTAKLLRNRTNRRFSASSRHKQAYEEIKITVIKGYLLLKNSRCTEEQRRTQSQGQCHYRDRDLLARNETEAEYRDKPDVWNVNGAYYTAR